LSAARDGRAVVTGGPMPLRAALKALVEQIDRTQWATPGEIASSQFRHLGLLADHCNRHSSFFAVRLQRAGLTPADLADPSGFERLPVMTRRDVQSAGEKLFCRDVPSGHGDVSETRTSGSTGEPVLVRRTAVNGLFWNAMVMRELLWHKRNLSGRLCTITPLVSKRVEHDDWGPPATVFARTGPMLSLPIAADVANLLQWVGEFQADFVALFPSTLDGFTTYCRRHGRAIPQLRQVLTIGETLSPSVREAAEDLFGVTVADCYSSEEFGAIAISCQESGLYHVMSESVLAEVLDDHGRPCEAGEVGRVTLTALHNYATPLVRYDIGDMAEVASPCPCGRGLPAWRRILGRQRNLILMPDGSRVWPVTGFPRCREVAPVVQYQLVQQDRETVEARLVVERSLSQAEEDGLRALFHEWIGHPFTLRFSYFDGRLPTGSRGKFEEFVCNVG
jgi:phenylacetate-coenzyme A ligase PaaK-like adenylate-forming protein